MNHHPQTYSIASKFASFCDVIEVAQAGFKVPGVAVGILYDEEEFTAGFGVTSVNHPLPTPPPMLARFTGPDQVEMLEGPFKGVKAEFARHADGAIRWLHTGGRIHHWVEQQP